jgi:hypothetical protein
MIKLPRPNHDYVDYEMTTSGKITLGAMLVEAVTGFLSMQQQQYHAPPPRQQTHTVASIMEEIDALPGMREKFDALTPCEQREVIREMLNTR